MALTRPYSDGWTVKAMRYTGLPMQSKWGTAEHTRSFTAAERVQK